MNPIQILWLYDDLLDLYGDSGNLTIVTRHLEQMGLTAQVTRLSLGDSPDFRQFQMVYIGPGKAKNLAKAAEHFSGFAQEVKQAVEQGVVFLVTGSARLLFGKGFTGEAGNACPGVGLFDYTGRETGSVFISDVIACPVFQPQAKGYGFINRTAHIEGENTCPLFQVISGAGDGEEPAACEGNLKNNFFGTWQLGPLLVKNPHLLKEILRRLAGDSYRETDHALAQKALELTLAEFPG